MLAEHELTPHHYGLLMVLEQMGSAPQQQLSRSLGIDPRNAVPLIDVLQQRDLVERQTDPTDRRRHAVALTPAGQALLGALRRAGEQVEHEFLDCLTPAEQANLHRTLTKLLTALNS
jgi:DNA-binding MarR family transcriptional regulator